MHLGQPEVTEDEAEIVAKRSFRRLDFRVGLASIGTLGIAIVDEDHGCVERTIEMVRRAA